MTHEEFWELLQELPITRPEVELETRLTHLDPDAIAAFQAHFDHEHARAYTVLLWGAAYIIGRGCSDDGFIDFRYGLIVKRRIIVVCGFQIIIG